MEFDPNYIDYREGGFSYKTLLMAKSIERKNYKKFAKILRKEFGIDLGRTKKGLARLINEGPCLNDDEWDHVNEYIKYLGRELINASERVLREYGYPKLIFVGKIKNCDEIDSMTIHEPLHESMLPHFSNPLNENTIYSQGEYMVRNVEGKYRYAMGTSLASPFVLGAFILFSEYFENTESPKENRVLVEDFKELLIGSIDNGIFVLETGITVNDVFERNSDKIINDSYFEPKTKINIEENKYSWRNLWGYWTC